jgi:DHA3 family macrolide efflux protein-like MFS transporter
MMEEVKEPTDTDTYLNSAASFRDVLRIASFRHLWIGQAISQFGDAFYGMVFLYMAEKLTGDPGMVGIVGVAQTLPYLALSLHAGVLADRIDRRHIMMASDIISAAILILFALLLWFEPRPPTAALIVTASLLSVANVFFAPAKGAAIPQLVPPSLLSVANGLSLATQSVTPLAGLALSGAILSLLYVLSPTYFFLGAILLNALSFAVSAYFLYLLPPLPPRENTPDEQTPTAWEDLKSGLTYIRFHPTLATIVILSMLIQGAVAPFMIVSVTVNSQWFGGEYWTLAACEGSFFLGMVIGGAMASRLSIRRPGIAFITGAAVIGVVIVFMAFSKWFPLFIFWNIIAGLFVPYSQLPILNYIQRVTPNEFQGRVNSALSLTSIGIQPLAIGLGGLALTVIGPSFLLILMGVGMILAALGGLLFPALRRAEILSE